MSEKEIIDSFSIPDSIEPVVGWRAWTVGGLPFERSPNKLRSPAHPLVWEPYEAAQAVCSRSVTTILDWAGSQTEHSVSVPVHGCTCGIYVTHSLPYAASYGHIIGQVYGWGKVVEHRRGWRVQYAYPKNIYTVLPYEFEDYGVPVHHLQADEWKEMTGWSTREMHRFQLLLWQVFGEMPLGGEK